MRSNNLSKFKVIFHLPEYRIVQLIFLSGFFCIGLLFRLASVVLTEGKLMEAEGYINFALAILSLDPSKVTIGCEPGFPVVLAFTFLFLPKDYLTTRIVTAVIGSLCIPMTFLTSNSLKNRLSEEGTEVSILLSYISSLLVALNPYLILADGTGLQNPLAALILLVLLYFVFAYQIRPTSKSIVIITILCIITISIKIELFLIIACLIFLMAFYDFIHLNHSEFQLKNYLVIIVLFLIAFIIENILLSFLYGGFIFDLRASAYFEREFGYYQSVTLVQYVFDHHTFMEIITFWYNGIHDSLNINRWIFTLFGFCLILVGYFYLVSKNAFEIPVCIFLAIASQAFFIHVWGWDDLWQFFLLYIPFACICMGYALIMIINTVRIQITPNKVLNVNKFILISIIVAYLIFVYSIEAFRLIG